MVRPNKRYPTRVYVQKNLVQNVSRGGSHVMDKTTSYYTTRGSPQPTYSLGSPQHAAHHKAQYLSTKCGISTRRVDKCK